MCSLIPVHKCCRGILVSFLRTFPAWRPYSEDGTQGFLWCMLSGFHLEIHEHLSDLFTGTLSIGMGGVNNLVRACVKHMHFLLGGVLSSIILLGAYVNTFC